jgi:hypothetical protein
MNTNSNVYSLRSSTKGNLFVLRPNSNFMKKLFITPELFYGYYLPTNLKLIQNIDNTGNTSILPVSSSICNTGTDTGKY